MIKQDFIEKWIGWVSYIDRVEVTKEMESDLDAVIKALKQHNVVGNTMPRLFGLFSPEDELMFVHKTREGAKKHQYEFEKAYGLGFYINTIIVLE